MTRFLVLLVALLCLNVAVCQAQPWADMSTACGGAVSVLILPDGQGTPMSDCYSFGGTRVDATITAHVYERDPYWGEFLFNYDNFPAEDIRLISTSGQISFCANPMNPDTDTDAIGGTTFSGTIFGGGHSQDNGTLAIQVAGVDGGGRFNGCTVYFNSPDIDGDLLVNLTDIAIFASHLSGVYDYCCDFAWDGVINLSDVAIMAMAWGNQCE